MNNREWLKISISSLIKAVTLNLFRVKGRLKKMAKKERPFSVEVQNGPIRMDAQYTEKFCREPEHTMRDMENLRMRRDKMTLTLHTPER